MHPAPHTTTSTTSPTTTAPTTSTTQAAGPTCTATASDPTPGDGGSETISITSNQPSAPITATADYKTVDHTFTGTTDSTGSGSVTFSIGSPTAGFTVNVDVTVGAASCSTSFTPQSARSGRSSPLEDCWGRNSDRGRSAALSEPSDGRRSLGRVLTFPQMASPEVLVLGAGFSKSLASTMPLTDQLGDDVLALVAAQTHLVRRRRFRNGQFETWLSRIAEPQPDLTPAENYTNRAVFEKCTEALAAVLNQRTTEAAPEALAGASGLADLAL